MLNFPVQINECRVQQKALILFHSNHIVRRIHMETNNNFYCRSWRKTKKNKNKKLYDYRMCFFFFFFCMAVTMVCNVFSYHWIDDGCVDNVIASYSVHKYISSHISFLIRQRRIQTKAKWIIAFPLPVSKRNLWILLLFSMVSTHSSRQIISTNILFCFGLFRSFAFLLLIRHLIFHLFGWPFNSWCVSYLLYR